MGFYNVQNVSFEAEGLLISYVRDDNIRKDGALVLMHQVFIAPHPDYYDALVDVKKQIEKLIEDAIEDWETAPVVEPNVEDEDPDDDDDEGMGF